MSASPTLYSIHLASLALGAALLAGCATQAPYAAPASASPPAWSAFNAPATAAAGDSAAWWTALHDGAVDALVDAALATNPTLEQALARLAEARANLAISAAQHLPALALNAGASRGRSLGDNRATTVGNAASAGPGLAWEADLFGRVRSSDDVASRRLAARGAEADGARLALAAQVASGVLDLRACLFSATVLDDDIAARGKTLVLTRRRLAAGFIAPVDEARAVTGLASAQTALALRRQDCARDVNALVALTGQDRTTVQALVDAPLSAPGSAQGGSLPRYAEWIMPQAPQAQLAQPALLLAGHPAVRASENEAAAAWAAIAVARAERLPRLELSAMLSGQWLSAAGSSLTYTAWSLAPALSAPLFDGGRGAANVAASAARYGAAAAALEASLRSAVQEVENALAAVASARSRMASARQAAEAAQVALDASESMWLAGAASLFELDDARRTLAAAQDSAIGAARDGGQAWIALVRAAGHSALTSESPRHDIL